MKNLGKLFLLIAFTFSIAGNAHAISTETTNGDSIGEFIGQCLFDPTQFYEEALESAECAEAVLIATSACCPDENGRVYEGVCGIAFVQAILSCYESLIDYDGIQNQFDETMELMQQ